MLSVLPPSAALLVADDDARFQEVNEAARRLLKYSEEQLKQLHVWDITVGAQREEARRMWRDFISQGRQAGIYQVRRSDGRQVTVQYEATANFRPGRHISILQPVAAARPASRPLDECPFERPFPRDFNLCPAYQPRIAQVADSLEQPVSQVWTCDHLVATKIPTKSVYYASCSIGDAIQRSRWLLIADQRGLMKVRRLRIVFYRAAEAEIRQLIAAQSAYWTASSNRDGLERLRAAGNGLMAAVATFIRKHEEGLAAADIDPTALQRCFDATIADAVQRREAQALCPPDELVARYPLTVQAFLRPELVTSRMMEPATA